MFACSLCFFNVWWLLCSPLCFELICCVHLQARHLSFSIILLDFQHLWRNAPDPCFCLSIWLALCWFFFFFLAVDFHMANSCPICRSSWGDEAFMNHLLSPQRCILLKYTLLWICWLSLLLFCNVRGAFDFDCRGHCGGAVLTHSELYSPAGFQLSQHTLRS